MTAPPREVFALGDGARGAGVDPLIDETQQPVSEQEELPSSVLNFHDLFKAKALDLQLPCQLLRPDTYGSLNTVRAKGRRIQDKATTAWNSIRR